MAELEENKVDGVFGGVAMENAGTIRNEGLPVKNGFWSKFKAFWLQEIDWNKEIKVELTPYQQKIEDEINEFLHQEITWEKVHDFLFQEIKFKKECPKGDISEWDIFDPLGTDVLIYDK